jgi:glycosyltransferase involved in cell wall biosynthesis
MMLDPELTSPRRKLRIVLFTLGNIKVPVNLRPYSLPEPLARETLFSRSQQFFDGLGRVVEIVAWGNGRLPSLHYTENERLQYAERCRQFLHRLELAGIGYDAIVQQGCHPLIFHPKPFFIWSDAGTPAPMDYTPLDHGKPPACNSVQGVENDFYRSATGILAFSPFAARNAVHLTGCIPERIHVVGAGVAELAPSNLIKPKGPPQLLWVGTDLVSKGGADLLSALPLIRERFPDVLLTLVGSSAPSNLAGVRSVKFLDHKHRGELLKLYRRATLLVMPSYKESFGLVYLEALAHKTPVLATSRGGMAELVHRHDFGRVVIPGDAPRIAAAVADMLSDRSSLEQQGERGYRYVQTHCSWPSVAARIASAISRSLRPSATKRLPSFDQAWMHTESP